VSQTAYDYVLKEETRLQLNDSEYAPGILTKKTAELMDSLESDPGLQAIIPYKRYLKKLMEEKANDRTITLINDLNKY
jgi:hypothetical protein